MRDWENDSATRRAVWIGLWGGGVAWLAHLLLAYLISEFGCLSGLDRSRWIGISLIAWMLLAVSLLTWAAAVAATWIAWRTWQILGHEPSSPEQRRLASDLARAGCFTSGAFAGVILVQAIPIFFFLSKC